MGKIKQLDYDITATHDGLIERLNDGEEINPASIHDLVVQIKGDKSQDLSKRKFYKDVLLFWGSYESHHGRENISTDLQNLE